MAIPLESNFLVPGGTFFVLALVVVLVAALVLVGLFLTVRAYRR